MFAVTAESELEKEPWLCLTMNNVAKRCRCRTVQQAVSGGPWVGLIVGGLRSRTGWIGGAVVARRVNSAKGFGNGVGMAIAERWLAATYNRQDQTIVDHRTYVLASDGDMMEGVTAEAASLAGERG